MTLKNEETKKTTPRGRKPRASNESLNTVHHVEENTRHIQENRQDIQNNTKMIHVLYSIIILLMVIIAGLAFWLWNVFSGNGWSMQGWNSNTGEISRTWEWVVITILDDARCNDCMTNDLRQQLEQSSFLSASRFVVRDFSESGVEELMRENNITTLPQILFNTNELWDGGQISPFLTTLTNGEFRLEIGEASSFNPFASRSDRGFLVMDLDILEQIKTMSFVKWNSDTPLTWIEYSDFGCAFCVRMHADDNTVNNVLATFPEAINSRFQHMAFRNTEVPETIECIAEQAGQDAFNTLIDEGFNARVNTRNDILAVAETQNINFNSSELESCIADGRMQRKIQDQMEMGQNIFWVRGTPWNVIVNVETWEYEVISWAYPQSTFEDAIRRLQ